MSQRETCPFQEQGEPEFQSEIEPLHVFLHPTAELDVDQERLQLAIEAAIVQTHGQRLGQEQAELEIHAQELAERRAGVQAELERRAREDAHRRLALASGAQDIDQQQHVAPVARAREKTLPLVEEESHFGQQNRQAQELVTLHGHCHWRDLDNGGRVGD